MDTLHALQFEYKKRTSCFLQNSGKGSTKNSNHQVADKVLASFPVLALLDMDILLLASGQYGLNSWIHCSNTLGTSYSAVAHFGGVTDWYQSQGYREPALVDFTKCLHRFAMSSDNASSAVTYTSVSSDSNGPSSWGIPLVNAGELPEMDPYEEVAQQGQAHPVSPAYVPDPMELDEHVPVYVLEPEHPEYHAPSDDDIQVEDQPYASDASPTAESPGYIADSDSMDEDTNTDSIDYPDEPEDGKEDDDEDPEEDPSEEHESEDDDDDDDTDDKDEEPTEEEEGHPTLADSSTVPVVDPVPSAGDIEAFETGESAPTPRSPQTRVPFS
ncbi:hypothetical protein Tco_0671218 [Tanacetum coccineum]